MRLREKIIVKRNLGYIPARFQGVGGMFRPVRGLSHIELDVHGDEVMVYDRVWIPCTLRDPYVQLGSRRLMRKLMAQKARNYSLHR